MLGHVAHESTNRVTVGVDLVIKYARGTAGGRYKAKEDLEKRALARPVGTDQTGDAGLDANRERVERDHGAEAPSQTFRLDHEGGVHAVVVSCTA